jgi:hypothetical protein
MIIPNIGSSSNPSVSQEKWAGFPRHQWTNKNNQKLSEITQGMTRGLYYKHMMIVNDDFSFVIKWSCKLIDDARVVIYDRNMFIIQATVANVIKNYGGTLHHYRRPRLRILRRKKFYSI